jgi:cellulose synthase/poly-beta-1,6-N-acetylglucosamine synthase-like glycosyltransferase
MSDTDITTEPATTESTVGIIIPAYAPDILVLEQFINDIRDVISPEVIRVEIDTPRRAHVNRLKEVVDEVSVSNSRRGKGAAIMEGFDSLDTDICVFADADGSVPAESVENLGRVAKRSRLCRWYSQLRGHS